MKFEGALIKEQGLTFAVVSVKEYVVNNMSEAEKAIQMFQPAFPGIPVSLVAVTSQGPKYVGRQDIVNFLASVPFENIPWGEFTID
mgnify:CR=1 FL=1|jgi:hypothetical protein